MKTGFSLLSENAPLLRIPAPRFFWAVPMPINTSLYSYPAEVWEQIPNKDIIIKLFVSIPIVLFGILGNVTLLEIILSSRALRTSAHLLIANLALIDLITLVLCPPIFLLHDIHQSYVLGPIGCKLEGFIEGGLLITSILALCVVSYDRLAAIVLPAKARMKRNCAMLTIGLCWCLGFAAALPLAIYRNFKERDWNNFHETFCSEDNEIMPTYWNYVIVMLVWMPLGVMTVTYSAIFCKLDRYEREAMHREHPMVVRYKSRVARTLFIVLMTFVVVRIPFTIMIIVYYKNVDKFNTFEVNESFVILWWLAKMSFIFLYSAMNPVIYGMTNRTFRKAYKNSKILGKLWRFSEEKTSDEPNTKRQLTFSRKILWPRGPCEQDKLDKQTQRQWGSKNRYIVANWLNSTIRYKDRRRSPAQQDGKDQKAEANDTKSSGTAQNS
ncbi:neuropeptide Y receptor type 2-like [Topomyia yanbarensis]|uniref:neuropeptide Y receptor type 2-like n=1 Tax=Topomyia yanbarensis TaxID=2498891 RepID=UPI00273C58A1|nr:neuropeptide Y receptor type 2-like [Topomyia yanbarensis]